MKPLSPLEAATLYLHAVDGETAKQIARRQGCDDRTVRRTLASARKKLDATTDAQAAIRAYTSKQLHSADRSYTRRESRASAEQLLVDKERRKQRKHHNRRGLNYDAPVIDDD